MKPRLHSLGTLLLLITGGLTLIVAFLAASEIAASVRHTREVTRLGQVTQVANTLFAAAETAAFERDVSISALEADDRLTRAGLAEGLPNARNNAVVASATALSLLNASAPLASRLDRIKNHFATIQALRRELDAALANPSHSEGDLPARWNNETSALISDVDELRLAYISPYANIDAVVTQQLYYNQALGAISDYSGRERSLVGHVLASGADATREQIAELNRGEGVLDANWRAALVFARQSASFPQVRSEYDDAKSQYDTLHGMLHEAFYGAGAGRHGAFPISAALWLELSDQYREALDHLRASSRRAMGASLERLIAAAQRGILLRISVLSVALGLCALGFWVVSHRVVVPIKRIVAALLAAAHGERVQFPISARNTDEIGQLVEVLIVFQEKVEAVARGAAELDASDRRLRAVVDNAIDGLITISAEGEILSFNPACERIFGYDPGEVVGANVSILIPEHASEQNNYFALYAGSGEGAAIGAARRELLARRKDGSLVPIDLSISGFRLPEGIRFSGIIRDITRRKQAEAAIAARTEALEQSNRELDDFAYIASHDLKEPLRGIHNHARFLLEDNARNLDEASVRRLNRLISLSQRMERLVNDLLYFSRLGRQDLAVQATDLGAVITDIEATLEHFLEERQARLIRADALPTVVCDKPRVTELFRNLITNAVKYNNSADKVVEVGALGDAVTPSGVRGRVFFVKDNGVGIAPEFHHEVFRIFKRLNNRTSEADGTGVGLTFVKKIVERHGGEIWIESTPGRGATFFFTLETTHDMPRAEAA